MHASKNPQSNAAFTKNIAGTTLYFVVDYSSVFTYTVSNGTIYITNGAVCTLNNGILYNEEGLKFLKV